MVGESAGAFDAQKDRSAARSAPVSFPAHVELLRLFLARRDAIVERIEALLNAQRKPQQYLQDAALLSRHFADCFFTLAGVTAEQARLERQLDEAHRASGFKPRQTPGFHNDIVDPAQMMIRAFHLWQHTRWPGRHGRAGYAQTLFNLYVLRRLMLLCMRLWDAGPLAPGERLAQAQAVLDELSSTTPSDQPVLVRDARWLFPLAQSPTTDELAGYFEVAERIAETLEEEDRLEISRASVRMAGGHLTSQLRHVSTQRGVSLADDGLILITRRSNALDLATLIQGLVPLLEAYEHAVRSGDAAPRTKLAGAICQGISPDPELFVNRLELLRPYSMIEHLFIAPDREGRVCYTAMGQRHLALLQRYEALIRRLAPRLLDDCPRFRPVAGSYSPYGALFGFSSQLLEHMALKTLAPDAVTGFSLEDVFTDGDADRLSWVSGWRRLPHVPRDVLKLFEYPQPFAEQVFDRIEQALRRRVAEGDAAAPGRLFIVADDRLPSDAQSSSIPDLHSRFFLSSDAQIAAAHGVELSDETQLLHSRVEGELIVSYPTSGGWVGITKDVLTEVCGAGRDAKIVGLPGEAAAVLQAMCPHLVLSTPPAAS